MVALLDRERLLKVVCNFSVFERLSRHATQLRLLRMLEKSCGYTSAIKAYISALTDSWPTDWFPETMRVSLSSFPVQLL